MQSVKNFKQRINIITNNVICIDEFSINITSIRTEIAALKKSSKNLYKQIDRLAAVKSELDKVRYGVNMAALTIIINKLEKEKQDCDELAETLDKIVELYVKTEKRLCA